MAARKWTSLRVAPSLSRTRLPCTAPLQLYLEQLRPSSLSPSPRDMTPQLSLLSNRPSFDLAAAALRTARLRLGSDICHAPPFPTRAVLCCAVLGSPAPSALPPLNTYYVLGKARARCKECEAASLNHTDGFHGSPAHQEKGATVRWYGVVGVMRNCLIAMASSLEKFRAPFSAFHVESA
ncbi:hypothetical protein IWX90DRAFT_443082 [Phyllosticta citrichinensis]|uniref:Uncharacterized protein n=1 Tax=Phyllosticta citrichinensis TaxID=1130410 RepID=A0ABR1XIC7_9PEZI